MAKPKTIILLTVFALSLASISFAEEKEGLIHKLRKMLMPKAAPALPAKEKSEPQKKELKEERELTKPELVERLKETIELDEEALDYIPELKKHTGRDAKAFYTFTIDGRDTRLEDLDEARLKNITGRINQTRTNIWADRINKQLEAIRQAHEAQQVINVPRPQAIPTPPRIPSAIVTPSTPQAPVTPPPPPPQAPPPPPKRQ